VATSIVFLRGINLGKARRVQMAALRELLAGHGHENVRTLLQSGNVILDSRSTGAKLERELERELEAGLGFRVDVFVRTRDELGKIVARNPLASVADDPAKYLVTFLRARLDPAVSRRLRALDLAPERLAIYGRELYTWHPGGLARTELRKHLTDRVLGVSSSGRNWSTVTKLLELVDG
jgi:uncharacterized protein (DUF1697 family)